MIMAPETSFDDIVPMYQEDEDVQWENLERLRRSTGEPRQLEMSDVGPWEVVCGTGLVFSAPHEVMQIRDDVEKKSERGTAELAFALARVTGGSALATTGSQLGDPNWDFEHPYVARAEQLASDSPLIDLHMMRPRGVEICLGLGPVPTSARELWEPFVD